MEDRHTKFIRRLLDSKHAEALEWLRKASPDSFRNLGEMDSTEESIRFVQNLYDLGAQKVVAVEIDEYDEGENTGHLVVELPPDPLPRQKLFAFERQHAESLGFDGVEDTGQQHLYLKLD